MSFYIISCIQTYIRKLGKVSDTGLLSMASMAAASPDFEITSSKHSMRFRPSHCTWSTAVEISWWRGTTQKFMQIKTLWRRSENQWIKMIQNGKTINKKRIVSEIVNGFGGIPCFPWENANEETELGYFQSS